MQEEQLSGVTEDCLHAQLTMAVMADAIILMVSNAHNKSV